MLCLPAIAQAQSVTRDIPVTSEFQDVRVGSTAGAAGFLARITVINVDGRIEVCGAALYNTGTSRNEFRGFLRDSAFMINGEKVIKDLSYWKPVRRNWQGAMASCRSTGLASSTSIQDMDIYWSKRRYRS